MDFDIAFHRYVTPREAATILGTCKQTLAHWRVQGGGPAYTKRTGRVRYWLPDLLKWMKDGEQRSTAEDPD